jgi:hypothetical protein
MTMFGTSQPLPGYWMNETSGALRPAVEAYLAGTPMNGQQIAAMRAYLRQWITSPQWYGPAIPGLRAAIDDLTSRESITMWLRIAEREGIDPL